MTTIFSSRLSSLPFTALTFITSCLMLSAADWAQWRGPRFDGSSPETGLPATFSKTENVLWTAPLPGASGATPVVAGDRVYVSSTDDATKTCIALAFDRKTGRELWRVKVADGVGKDRMSTYANSSPLSDGKHAWFFYGTGDLVCLDADGKIVWSRNVQKEFGPFAFMWTFSSSPVLFDGRLYVQVLQRDVPVDGRGRTDGPNESYLLALEPTTGKLLWRIVRPSDAKEESRESFATLTPYTADGKSQLLIAGGDCLTGNDPATGAELWRWGTWNPTRIGHWRFVPSPVAGGGVALVCAPKDAPIYAVKLGGKGTLTHQNLAWQSYLQNSEQPETSGRSLEIRELSSDVPSPAFYEGNFYVLNGTKQKLFCFKPSGEMLWSGSVKGKAIFQSSPTVADGKVFMMNFAGEVFVVRAGGTEFQLLQKADFGENDNNLRAAIPISHGQLFIRTTKTLYCVGSAK